MIYKKENETSFALGAFAVRELLEHKIETVRKIYISRDLKPSIDIDFILNLAKSKGIRIEDGTKIIDRIGGKENIYIMAEFFKYESVWGEGNQIVLYNPADMGNVGTILRTALGFGYHNIAFIKPCVDVFNPKVIRASQGAIFSLNIRLYENFDEYLEENKSIKKYLFMLDGENILQNSPISNEPKALVFGNEASGLPPEVRQYGIPVFICHSKDIDSLNLSISIGIAMYHFSQKSS